MLTVFFAEQLHKAIVSRLSFNTKYAIKKQDVSGSKNQISKITDLKKSQLNLKICSKIVCFLKLKRKKSTHQKNKKIFFARKVKISQKKTDNYEFLNF